MISTPGLMAFLASSFGVSNGAGSETAHIYEGLENASNLLALSLTNSPNAPRAYLMCMVFDQDYVLIDPTAVGYDFYAPVPEAAATETQNISLEIDIPENAKYIYTYVANESAGTHVFFDDFTVKQLGVDITQTTDYYPGGSIASHWQKENYRFGYQGEFAEEDEETGFNFFELRAYDNKINRWMVMDPARQHASPYLSMGNNWIERIDPDGGLDIFNIDISNRTVDQTVIEGSTTDTYNIYDGETLLDSYTLDRNSLNLVAFPETGPNWGRYGIRDAGGDNYANYIAAAKFFGLLYDFGKQLPGQTVYFDDISAPDLSNLGHDTHYDGRDFDIRYIGFDNLANKAGNTADCRTCWNKGVFGERISKALNGKKFNFRGNNVTFLISARQWGFNQNYAYDRTLPNTQGTALFGHRHHMHIGIR